MTTVVTCMYCFFFCHIFGCQVFDNLSGPKKANEHNKESRLITLFIPLPVLHQENYEQGKKKKIFKFWVRLVTYVWIGNDQQLLALLLTCVFLCI